MSSCKIYKHTLATLTVLAFLFCQQLCLVDTLAADPHQHEQTHEHGSHGPHKHPADHGHSHGHHHHGDKNGTTKADPNETCCNTQPPLALISASAKLGQEFFVVQFSALSYLAEIIRIDNRTEAPGLLLEKPPDKLAARVPLISISLSPNAPPVA